MKDTKPMPETTRSPEAIIREAIGKGISWDGLTIGRSAMAKQVIGDLYAAGYQIVEAGVVSDGQ